MKQVEEHVTGFVTYPKIFQMNWKVIHKPELMAQRVFNLTDVLLSECTVAWHYNLVNYVKLAFK